MGWQSIGSQFTEKCLILNLLKQSARISNHFTTIHLILKGHMKILIINHISNINGTWWQTLVLLRKDKSLVVIKQADSQKEISKDGNIKVHDFLIDSILVEFGGRIFQLSAFQLIRNLHPYLPTCFYIHMNLYKRACDMLTIASPCEPLAWLHTHL